jgi:hypothetical protein
MFFAVLMLYPVGKQTAGNSAEALAMVHRPIASRIPAPPELEEAYDLAIPGHARIRCPAPEGTEDHIGLRAESTGNFGESSLRWIDIRDGHVNAATTDSSGEVMVYAGTVPLGIIRWSEPSPGAWTHCSMVAVEYVERDGLVVDDYGHPAGRVNVSLCANRATQSDHRGRFTVEVPAGGHCTIRTFDIQETELYLGLRRTVDSEVPKNNAPFKVDRFGELEHVNLDQLKRLTAQRIRRLDERGPAIDYTPIQAALRLTDAPESTRRVLQQWADVEETNSARAQFGNLLREDVTLENYRDALLFGALADL